MDSVLDSVNGIQSRISARGFAQKNGFACRWALTVSSQGEFQERFERRV